MTPDISYLYFRVKYSTKNYNRTTFQNDLMQVLYQASTTPHLVIYDDFFFYLLNCSLFPGQNFNIILLWNIPVH